MNSVRQTLLQAIITSLFLFTVGAAQTPLPSRAQTLQPTASQSGSEHKVHGYVFAGPAFSRYGDSALTAGFGFEGLVHKGFGVGGDLAYLGRGADGVGALSANASYHFQNAGKVTPFVTGGYTLFFRDGVANGVNGGGGINYWFKERMAFRAEARVQSFVAEADNTIFTLRFGLTFR